MPKEWKIIIAVVVLFATIIVLQQLVFFPPQKYRNTADTLQPTAKDSITVVISTFLGNEHRNYYGNRAPSRLDEIWRIELGEGVSPAYGEDKVWKGAGWTGQPLFVREDSVDYLIQGAFDYHLKKIEAATGRIVWEYQFDDILKGTGTIWVNDSGATAENRYIVLQGSRKGVDKNLASRYVPSFRGISYITGNELWRINIKATDSYSRDVDGSALVLNDTAYLAFENGIFTVFSPDPELLTERDSMLQPRVFQEIQYYNADDMAAHGHDLVAEASPTLLGNRIYTPSGTGWVYGYNLHTRRNDWEFYIGTDLNGSAPATYDNCLLVPVEKEYMPGQGGVFKLNPAKPPDEAVEWFFPVQNKKWFHWEGGIVGSVAVNDAYATSQNAHLAAFIGVDGFLYVVRHDKIAAGQTATGPDGKTEYPMPQLIYKQEIGGTIGTPILVENRLIAPLDTALFLFEHDEKLQFTPLDTVLNIEIDATPIAVDGRIYIASRNGYMYCFGEKEE